MMVAVEMKCQCGGARRRYEFPRIGERNPLLCIVYRHPEPSEHLVADQTIERYALDLWQVAETDHREYRAGERCGSDAHLLGASEAQIGELIT